MLRTRGRFSIVSGVLFAPLLLMGQFDQGQIAGTVTDPTHAAVAKAAVIAIDSQTGRHVSTITDGSGGYVLVGLRVGTYSLEIEASGFRKFIQETVKIDAAMRTTIDAVLTLGAVTESVTVAGQATPLQAETSGIGRTVTDRQISDLALNGRNPMNLVLTKAGVLGGNFNSFNPIDLGGAFFINGSPTYGNSITIDGVGLTRTRGDGATGMTLIGVFNTDTLQEVQILTSSYPAEFGRSMTGAIRLVTKSGAREFHGSAWEFFRNSVFDANTWVRNSSGTSDAASPAPFRFNQPGYSIGGPVIIPGRFNTSRDRLFFFASQEWVRYRQRPSGTGVVPSLAMRQGDFSELLSASNLFFRKVEVVRDPTNNTPFPNNVIPTSRLSQNGIGLLKAFPVPTVGFQQGSNNWYDSQPKPDNTRKDLVRLDYLRGVHRVSLSATNFNFREDDPFARGFDVSDTRWDRPNYTAALNVTSTVTPRMVNELTATWADDVVRMYLYDINGQPLYERSRYGIDFPYAIPGPKRVTNRIPTIDITGFTSLDGSSKPGFSSGPMYSISDNVTVVPNGAHTIKFGAFFEKAAQINADQVAYNQNGWFTFRDSGNPRSSGVAIANAALGNFDTYFEIGPAADTHVRSYALEGFAQDTWKITPRLTMEYGVRYSFFQPWHADWNDIANFDSRYYSAANRAIVDPVSGGITSGDPYNGIVLPGNSYPASAAGRAQGAFVPNVQRLFHGLPDGFVDSYHLNFSPRLGIAWRLNNRTVIRSGGGLFRARQGLYNSSLFRNAPNQARVDTANGLVDSPGGAGLTLPFTIGSVSNEYRYPTSFNYSLSVQRELPTGFVLDVSYVGNTGMNLLRTHNINQMTPGSTYAAPSVSPNALRPYLGLAVINNSEQSGRSNYNALQVTLSRRFHSGFGVDVAYTFSKNLDNTSTPYDAYHFVRAPSSWDRTQVLTFNYIYELPFFRARQGATGNLLGNWQISGVSFLRSGDPLSVVDSTDTAGVGSGSASQPWNVVGNTAVSGATGVGQLWFNPAAFAVPAKGTFGNAGLNLLRGPMFQNWDMALFKRFKIQERLSTQFRFEVFNFLNHPNLADPVVSPRSGSFGYITSKSGNRNIQLALKFLF